MDPTSELMLTGERPTQTGYYVAKPFVRTMVEGSQVVQVFESEEGKALRVLVVGTGEAFALDDFKWIARLYPDRIEGMAG